MKLRALNSSLTLTAAVVVFAAAIFLLFGNMKRPDASAAEANEVIIDNYAFGPLTMTVPVGTAVTWVNQDSDIHSVAADDGDPVMFKSAGLDTDDKFTFTFAKPGTYAYHCGLHPHMTGKIVVQ